MSARHIEDLLMEAYGDDGPCPAPEAFLRSSTDGLTREERERLERHAETCPACAAERKLAREFDATPRTADPSSVDLQYVVNHLEAHPVVRGTAPAPRARPASRLMWSWGLAAAAVLVVAVGGVMLRGPSAPTLPSLGPDTVLRGARVEVEFPRGDLDAVPRTMRWESVDGAAGYRVVVTAVDDTILIENTTEIPSIELSDEDLGRMHPAVVYFWQVEALDSQGSRLAASERVRFRARATGESRD